MRPHPALEPDPSAVEAVEESTASAGGFGSELRLILASTRGLVGILIIGVFILLAIFGQALAPSDPFEPSSATLSPPSASHLLGTTQIGADVLSQVMAGARASVVVGLAAAVIAMVIGTLVGVVGGYYGGRTGDLLGFFEDLFLVLPALPLIIVIARVVRPSLALIVIIIGITSWAGAGRIIRSQVVAIRELPFIERAHAIGLSDLRILSRHVLPNVAPLIIANTIITVSIAILTEAGLSFLGLGPPGSISWGGMLEEAVRAGAPAAGAWWWVIPPGVCIVLLVLAVTTLGIALEERFDPRLRAAVQEGRSK